MARFVKLAAEGSIDFAVLRRLARDAGFEPSDEHGGRGKGQLDLRLSGYNNAAKFESWIVCRDLDKDAPCPGGLASVKLPKTATYMCFRIAVRSIEAWMTADRIGFANFFHVVESNVSIEPELIEDPKLETLRLLAKSSLRGVRDAMVRKNRDGSLSAGPEYNSLFIEFVTEKWKPERASKSSQSLRRARQRITDLARFCEENLPGRA